MQKNLVKNLSEGWQFKREGSNKFFSAEVPGCVHLDLIKHGMIPDPFFRENEKEVQWVSDTNWNYQLTFSADDKTISKKYNKLIFYGIDTYADIYFNGEKIFEADNMFHPWEFDVSKLIKGGQNRIEIQFRSPLKEVEPVMEKLDYKLPADNDQAGGTSPYTRKAPYHYGWDWGPCLVTSGLWKKVELISFNSTYVENISFNQLRCDASIAELAIEVEFFSNSKQKYHISVEEETKNIREEFEISALKGNNNFFEIIKIIKPELWWPSGHGKQYLYNFKIKIHSVDFNDAYEKRIGIRDVLIKRDKDKDGESFAISVNGKPIYSKGANWIPADSFTTRIKRENYKSLLGDAVKANMNTLRVWGGGIYEPDCFYELCDEMGIMVWQDFMFACSLYPADVKFLKSVEREATYQVKRLKDYASIILWCGNNEIAWAWHNWEWKENLPEHLWEDYKLLFHKTLPDVCKKYDPKRLYWPTSPGHTTEAPEEGQAYGGGDNHFWGVWHGGEDFDAYEKNVGRYMSEYGMQSFPELKTIKEIAHSSDLAINSGVMTSHQKASLGNKNVIMYMEKYYSKPINFDSLLKISQLTQAEAIKVAVESHRRKMPYCMGTLYWQLNDCWPGASWSSIDYKGRWKALHYAAKNFFQPIYISIKQVKNNIEIYGMNDINHPFKGDLVVQVLDFNGESLSTLKKSIKLKSVSASKILTFDVGELIDDEKINRMLIRASLNNKIKQLSQNEFYFAKPKELQIPKPRFDFEYKILNGEVEIIIKAHTFIYKAFIICDKSDGLFSENFMDLIPGELKKVKFKKGKKSDHKLEDLTFIMKSYYELVHKD